jgi:hypothetical protein
MEVGAVGFKDEKLRKFVNNVSRDKEIVKRIEKTEVEAHPNLDEEREAHINAIKRE